MFGLSKKDSAVAEQDVQDSRKAFVDLEARALEYSETRRAAQFDEIDAHLDMYNAEKDVVNKKIALAKALKKEI